MVAFACVSARPIGTAIWRSFLPPSMRSRDAARGRGLLDADDAAIGHLAAQCPTSVASRDFEATNNVRPSSARLANQSSRSEGGSLLDCHLAAQRTNRSWVT